MEPYIIKGNISDITYKSELSLIPQLRYQGFNISKQLTFTSFRKLSAH